VDFSENMIAIAAQKCRAYPYMGFQVASATALPWASPSFDRVVCANAFHYFERPEQVLAEMHRVLQQSGTVVILDWCRDFWVCQVCDWILGWLDPAHQYCYTERELQQILQSAGYQVLRSHRLRFGLIWGVMAVEARATLP
jgi:ubiquinone/menaquinone biosynthesis C-methylase UbiE